MGFFKYAENPESRGYFLIRWRNKIEPGSLTWILYSTWQLRSQVLSRQSKMQIFVQNCCFSYWTYCFLTFSFLSPSSDIRDLTKPRRRRQLERQKTIGVMSKTKTLHVHHAFLYVSLPSLHNYDVKWPNFKFTCERERQGDKFYHLCVNLSAFLSLQLQPKVPSFK